MTTINSPLALQSSGSLASSSPVFCTPPSSICQNTQNDRIGRLMGILVYVGALRSKLNAYQLGREALTQRIFPLKLEADAMINKMGPVESSSCIFALWLVENKSLCMQFIGDRNPPIRFPLDSIALMKPLENDRRFCYMVVHSHRAYKELSGLLLLLLSS